MQGRDTDLVGTAASASQGIVGAAELAERPLLRRGELLEVIPGVVVTQHSGDGKANQYFLRGFNLDHGTDFSVSVDGMPVNMRSHAHGQGYADINFLIPELVRQVDYNKGPFFADVGDFSAAGAAEFRLFDALPRPFVTVSVGENNYRRLVAGGTVARGQAETTGAVEYTHDDGPWKLSEDANRFNGFARRHWAAGGNDYRLTAMAYHGKWRSTDQIPLRAVKAGTLDRFGNIDPSDGGEADRASVSFDATLKSAGGTTRVNAYALYNRLNLYSNFTYFLDDPVNGDQFNQRERRVVFGGAVTQTRSGEVLGAKSDFVAGLQVRADEIGELGLHRTVERVRLATVRDDEVSEASAGVFGRVETRWSDTVRTTAGLRLDGYRFKVDSVDTRNSGTRLADIFSPKVGVVFGPWSRTEIYANAGDGFHSNDARGTTIRIDPADGVTPVDRVNPLVRSRGAELGVRTAAVPGLVSSVTVWALDLDSELVFVGDAGGTEPTARTRRYGVELANHWKPTPWLALEGDVALTHARYRDNPANGHVANSIKTVVSGGLTVAKREGWLGSVRVRYFGSQPLTEDNSVRAPSSLTFNARIGWRAKDWEVALDVLNVLDRASYDIAYAYASRLRGEPAAGVDDIHFHPAEPRTFRLGVTRRF
ncbi:MAG: TonB-dependent receptor [Verrucomicrobia bacterium]|nr:TonB-dependent receptor [Verrucomicrobiota bacterium]